MNGTSTDNRLQLPDQLRDRLTRFRKRVWWVKSIEGVSVGIVCLLVSFLVVFTLDRIWDTSSWLRLGVLLAGSVGMLLIFPLMLKRWVWGSRRLEDVARILRQKHSHLGDRLLGIVELAHSRHPLLASPELCRAAIGQVADDTRDYDFQNCVPDPRHRSKGAAAGGAALVALAVLLVPGAGFNALQRWAMPLADVPRYTFAQLVPLPDQLVVPIGEPFSLPVQIAGRSQWVPSSGSAQYAWQDKVHVGLSDGMLVFPIPAQKKPGTVTIRVGDAVHRMRVVPMSRPELTALGANVRLPGYLGYPAQKKDVRGGSITLVRGSQAVFSAVATREIANAAINKTPTAKISGNTVVSPELQIEQPSIQEFSWTDIKGLSSKQPFKLKIRPVDDEAPYLQCRDLARERVVLDEEVLTFEISSEDDFGVKKIGIQWNGVAGRGDVKPVQKGEYILAGGGQQEKRIDAQGTFSAKKLGIDPQPIELRVFAEDYLPGRKRVYSPVHRIFVLSAEQHMVWLTEKLQDWQRQVLEVRDTELRLHDGNVELQKLSPSQLDNPGIRRKIGQQAAEERANGRRLGNLTLSGEQLIAQAIRNEQFNTNTLENWAKALQGLKELSANRMPSVANLLDQAAGAPSGGGAPPKAPGIVDVEASPNEDPAPEAGKTKPDDQDSKSGGKLGLAGTIVRRNEDPRQENGDEDKSADQGVDEAVEEQKELIDEFNRLMDEMAEILNDLHGSTFVKRLKFAARREKTLAGSLHKRLHETFGKPKNDVSDADQKMFEQLYQHQTTTADDVSLIQEDLLGYFQRTQESKFNQVYREMKDTRVVTSLREVSRGVVGNLPGESIAEAEYWIDQLDRWADILVGPG